MHDLPAVLRGVAAVDRSPGHVDERVGAVDPARPVTEPLGIPVFDAPGRPDRRAPEHGHLVTIAMKRPRQGGSDLSRAPGDDDLHRLTRTWRALPGGRPGRRASGRARWSTRARAASRRGASPRAPPARVRAAR